MRYHPAEFPTTRSIHCAFSNRTHITDRSRQWKHRQNCQQLNVKKPQTELCALLVPNFQQMYVRCVAESLRSSHRREIGWNKLHENVRGSLFNYGLSFDTTFSQIHLDGQYHGRGNYKDTKIQMLSLLVFIRVYRLEIQSVMLVFSTPLVN